MQSSFFDPSGAHDPVWMQHLFWFLGQPIVILAALGLVLFLAALLLSRRGRWQKLVHNSVAAAFTGLGVLVMVWGGVSAWLLSSSAVRGAYHDTYYVVAHFHYVLGLAVAPFVFAVIYAFFQRIIGVPYRRWLGWLHWATTFLAGALLVLPQFLLASPSRENAFKNVDEVMREVEISSMLTGAAVIVTLTSVLFFAICLIEGILRRMKHGRASMPSRVES